MKIVVATKKRYVLTPGGKIDKRFEETLRTNMKVSEDYVEMHNANTKINGVFFVVDEEKTAEYHKACEKVNADRNKQQEMKEALAFAKLEEAAGVAKQAVVSKRGRKPKTQE